MYYVHYTTQDAGSASNEIFGSNDPVFPEIKDIASGAHFGAGFCYLYLINPSFHNDAASTLGAWPEVRQIRIYVTAHHGSFSDCLVGAICTAFEQEGVKKIGVHIEKGNCRPKALLDLLSKDARVGGDSNDKSNPLAPVPEPSVVMALGKIQIVCLKLCLVVSFASLALVVGLMVSLAPLIGMLLVPFLGLFFALPLGLFAWWPLLLAILLFSTYSLRGVVKREARIVRLVGPSKALWVDTQSVDSCRKVSRFVISHMSHSAAKLTNTFWHKTASSLLKKKVDDVPLYYLSSYVWSETILWLESLCSGLLDPTGVFIAVLSSMLAWYWRHAIVRAYNVIRYGFLVCVFVILATPGQAWVILYLSTVAFNFIAKFMQFDFLVWVKWQLTVAVVWLTNHLVEYEFLSRKWADRQGFNVRYSTSTISSAMTTAVTKFTIVLSDMGLPSFVRGASSHYGTADLQSTLVAMRDAGWPINVELNEPSRFGSSSQYSDWLLTGTNWAQGISNAKMWVDEALDPLRVHAVEWKRTEEYASYQNELESTSRYFKSPKYNFPDLELDDVWLLVGDIYKHSQLTPFGYIIRKWEKKYGLGSFMRDPKRPRAKYRRSDFIALIGYKKFKQIWRRTFEIASTLTPVAAVSVKTEALSPKKYANDIVRTVVGSPIGQYIMSTVWNYKPNHNFRWKDTPVKVGMPLNGAGLDFVYKSHSRCQHHYAGDMTAFDSTVSGKVVEMIKLVRKKGYEHHKDADRIAYLIDNNYVQVSRQLLNTTSTGDIYRKGTGLTTGHSSTTADNSLANIILYLMAWKEITGLRASDFKHFNELSVFGDDHIISFLATKPAGWTFGNIQRQFAKMGITLRAEASGKLTNIPFLSKWARSPTDHDLACFQRLGLVGPAAPTYAIVHDKQRLIGKLTAKVKSMDVLYRVNRLMSYISLTAHHPDVHKQLYDVLVNTKSFQATIANRRLKIPTYDEVMKQWYDPATIATNDPDDDTEDKLSLDNIVVYGVVSPIDSLLSVAASVPDLVNPSLFNFGYMRSLQARLSPLCSWPIALIGLQNKLSSPSEIGGYTKRTCYDFLDPMLCSAFNKDDNLSSLLMRHWAYCAYLQITGGRRESGMVTRLSRKISDLAFILNGKLQMESRAFDFKVIDLFIVVLLSFLHVPDGLRPIGSITLPNVSIWVERLWSFFVFKFWTSLPPNYNDLNVMLRTFSPGSRRGNLVVQAPTGTGKSTALIHHLAIILGFRYDKIVVIEPRSSIVRSLVPYMQSVFALDVSGATSGMALDPRAKVWYVTAQEALLHPHWLTPENLIVVDEAHVEEHAYTLLRKELLERGEDFLYLSATPSEVICSGSDVVPLTTARVWSVSTRSFDFMLPGTVAEANVHYRNEALNVISMTPQSSKALVFCNTITECNTFASMCPRHVVVLSSNSRDLGVSSSTQVYVATSVADVGLTIPDVDLVITSDYGIDVAQTMKGVSVRYFRLAASTLDQRAGRTGRTNHGVAHIYRYPSVKMSVITPVMAEEEKLLSLFASGIPMNMISKHYSKELQRLLGVESQDETLSNAALQQAMVQLDLYRDNLMPLLQRRMELQGLETSDHTSAYPIDTARLGLLRESSMADVSVLIESVVKVAIALGHRSVASGAKARRLEKVIRNYSANLLGNIRSKLPYPDPDLGEWGMNPE